ncbi:hypothetical protein DID88_006347 [Monilinia fructigena]|uniref:Uncharacterized protein n=1 Tax=Monilinia fructigena TaxID=38457 RepID=A0A395J2F7_9HELO|nr:hypothetical protein DID88_006347 [Monilinia fructigena]
MGVSGVWLGEGNSKAWSDVDLLATWDIDVQAETTAASVEGSGGASYITVSYGMLKGHARILKLTRAATFQWAGGRGLLSDPESTTVGGDDLVLKISSGSDGKKAEGITASAGDDWGCSNSASKEGSDEGLGKHFDYFLKWCYFKKRCKVSDLPERDTFVTQEPPFFDSSSREEDESIGKTIVTDAADPSLKQINNFITGNPIFSQKVFTKSVTIN